MERLLGLGKCRTRERDTVSGYQPIVREKGSFTGMERERNRISKEDKRQRAGDKSIAESVAGTKTSVDLVIHL
jgi:hypothetical protein